MEPNFPRIPFATLNSNPSAMSLMDAS
uniref:Disease resistance protein RGA2-like n=1 Tax=Rhizophora mucronata TaxID=61149 RepID=A0A2P2LN78_RHIMU